MVRVSLGLALGLANCYATQCGGGRGSAFPEKALRRGTVQRYERVGGSNFQEKIVM